MFLSAKIWRRSYFSANFRLRTHFKAKRRPVSPSATKSTEPNPPDPRFPSSSKSARSIGRSSGLCIFADHLLTQFCNCSPLVLRADCRRLPDSFTAFKISFSGSSTRSKLTLSNARTNASSDTTRTVAARGLGCTTSSSPKSSALLSARAAASLFTSTSSTRTTTSPCTRTNKVSPSSPCVMMSSPCTYVTSVRADAVARSSS
mmetsp:Transcript_46783/g.87867  ORF Transcript_46783/g.87867 Transcript_46783/m.87867 type:complete len:203 (-) Transcript_46783:364-972(-)